MFSTLTYIIILALGFVLGYNLFDYYQATRFSEEEYISITEKGRKALEAHLNKSSVVNEVLKEKENNDV